MVFSGPSCGRKEHQSLYISLSPQHPFYGGRKPSKKNSFRKTSLDPSALFFKEPAYSSLPKLILGLCSSEVMSLGTIQKNNLGDLGSNPTSTINSLFLSFQANPFSFPGVTMVLRSHSLIHTPHVYLYLPMLRPTMGAPLCPKKSGLGPNLPSSWMQGEWIPNGKTYRHKRIRRKGNPIATCRAEKVGRKKWEQSRSGMENHLKQLTISAAVSKYPVYWFHWLCGLADYSISVTSSLISSDFKL